MSRYELRHNQSFSHRKTKNIVLHQCSVWDIDSWEMHGLQIKLNCKLKEKVRVKILQRQRQKYFSPCFGCFAKLVARHAVSVLRPRSKWEEKLSSGFLAINKNASQSTSGSSFHSKSRPEVGPIIQKWTRISNFPRNVENFPRWLLEEIGAIWGESNRGVKTAAQGA